MDGVPRVERHAPVAAAMACSASHGVGDAMIRTASALQRTPEHRHSDAAQCSGIATARFAAARHPDDPQGGGRAQHSAQGLRLAWRRKGKAPLGGAAQRDGKVQQCSGKALSRTATLGQSNGLRGKGKDPHGIGTALVCDSWRWRWSARTRSAWARLCIAPRWARQSSAWQWRRFERMAATRDASA